jgi:hypothetical protein
MMITKHWKKLRKAKCLYDQQRGIPTFQKAWEEKMKSKVEQRKKGTKPPFFRNTVQGKATSKEPKMTEAMEARPRKYPMKCWGCDGNYVFRDLPQRGEKARTSHNVGQDATIEDMGRSVPRIYASLDNKQDEFQSHMIEVEGKINDQPIAILIE